MKRIPFSLMFLMCGYLGILLFATVFCHIKQNHIVKGDERILNRVAKQ